MVRLRKLQAKSTDDTRQILQDSGVAQCAIYVERVGEGRKESQHWTVNNNTNGVSNTTGSDDTTIYGIGSITKLLIALLLSIIVDKLSKSDEEEHKQFRELRRQWDKPWEVSFADLFNGCKTPIKMLPLPRNPTLRHVALHYNSFPPMIDVLLALDGTSIMSKSSFLRVAPRVAQMAYKDSTEDYNEYSNSNYIYIGYLIEAIGGDTLAALIQKHLFDMLGMNFTYMTAPTSSSSHIARPYSVSADGTRNRVDPWPYDKDSVVASAFGIYSCTRDLAILLRAIQAAISGAHPYLTQEMVADILKPEGTWENDQDTISLFGMYTALDTSTPGCKSYNRLISKDECSTYALGYEQGLREVKAYYLAGATKGYSCSAYFLPKHGTFVIVLTNTTGFSDASDHISRLILQKLFDLSFPSPSKLAPFGRIFRKLKDTGDQSRGSTNVVDIVEMSALAAAAGKKLLQAFATEDAEENVPEPPLIRLDGQYYNEQTEQSILITGDRAQIVGTADGPLGIPRRMGIMRTGDWTIRFRPLSNLDFTIDRYASYGWRDLNFELSTDKKEFKNGDKVICLTSKGSLPREFKRPKHSSEES